MIALTGSADRYTPAQCDTLVDSNASGETETKAKPFATSTVWHRSHRSCCCGQHQKQL